MKAVSRTLVIVAFLFAAAGPLLAGSTVFTMINTDDSGVFADDWIEDLVARGITAGCSAAPPLYCPLDPMTRGQMATFIVKTFDMQP